MLKYHCCYMFTKTDGSFGYGTTFASTNMPIDSQKAIEEIQDSVLNERQLNDSMSYKTILLTNWTLLKS